MSNVVNNFYYSSSSSSSSSKILIREFDFKIDIIDILLIINKLTSNNRHKNDIVMSIICHSNAPIVQLDRTTHF